jgi:hypothetical protein
VARPVQRSKPSDSDFPVLGGKALMASQLTGSVWAGFRKGKEDQDAEVDTAPAESTGPVAGVSAESTGPVAGVSADGSARPDTSATPVVHTSPMIPLVPAVSDVEENATLQQPLFESNNNGGCGDDCDDDGEVYVEDSNLEVPDPYFAETFHQQDGAVAPMCTFYPHMPYNPYQQGPQFCFVIYPQQLFEGGYYEYFIGSGKKIVMVVEDA